jgi:ABC-type glutathione transport system ATPase component
MSTEQNTSNLEFVGDSQRSQGSAPLGPDAYNFTHCDFVNLIDGNEESTTHAFAPMVNVELRDAQTVKGHQQTRYVTSLNS